MLDEVIVFQQLPRYPLKFCLVSKDKFSRSKKPINYVYKNRLVRLCSEECVIKFNKSSPKFLSILEKAVLEEQKPTYPLKECIVSGISLEKQGTPIDYVHANQLVRLCCKGCVAEFRDDAARLSEKIDYAVKSNWRSLPQAAPAEKEDLRKSQ